MTMHEFAQCLDEPHQKGSFFEALDRLRKSTTMRTMLKEPDQDQANPRGWQAWDSPPAAQLEPPELA